MTNNPQFNMGKPVDPPPIDLSEPTLAGVVEVTSSQAHRPGQPQQQRFLKVSPASIRDDRAPNGGGARSYNDTLRPSRADCFSASTSRIVSRACSGVMIGSTVSPATARAKCSISRE